MSHYILKTIDDDIRLCETYAKYWIALATTGVAQNRRLYHGTSGPEFTDDEKVEEAMRTANTHIERMRELMDRKKSLLYGEEPMSEVEESRIWQLVGDEDRPEKLGGPNGNS